VSLTPAERTQRAILAANRRWAEEPDRKKATEPARRAARERFLSQAEELHPGASAEFQAKVAANLAAEHQARMTLAASIANRKSRNMTNGAPDHKGAAVNTDPGDATSDVEQVR
jgi:hypothetical protein